MRCSICVWSSGVCVVWYLCVEWWCLWSGGMCVEGSTDMIHLLLQSLLWISP